MKEEGTWARGFKANERRRTAGHTCIYRHLVLAFPSKFVSAGVAEYTF